MERRLENKGIQEIQSVEDKSPLYKFWFKYRDGLPLVGLRTPLFSYDDHDLLYSTSWSRCLGVTVSIGFLAYVMLSLIDFGTIVNYSEELVPY